MSSTIIKVVPSEQLTSMHYDELCVKSPENVSIPEKTIKTTMSQTEPRDALQSVFAKLGTLTISD